jgi:hypothetical protein
MMIGSDLKKGDLGGGFQLNPITNEAIRRSAVNPTSLTALDSHRASGGAAGGGMYNMLRGDAATVQLGKFNYHFMNGNKGAAGGTLNKEQQLPALMDALRNNALRSLQRNNYNSTGVGVAEANGYLRNGRLE